MSPAQMKRCKMISGGRNPAVMPCRAATKPAAQNSAAPTPQRTPSSTGGPIEEPAAGGLGALTEVPHDCWSRQTARDGSRRRIEHDPEKWKPVFGKACPRAGPGDHAP